MSRQSRNIDRERKSEESKRDVSENNERYSRQSKEETRNNQDRDVANQINGLDRYRLNDLYERSSL